MIPFVSSNQIVFPFAKLNLILVTIPVKILIQCVNLNLIHLFQLHIGLFELFCIGWYNDFVCEIYWSQS